MIPTALLALALAAPPADPVDAFKEAEALCAADRFGDAEPLYLAAIRTDDRYLKRRAYERLLRLYVRSGRQDKAIRLAAPFGDWLRAAGDGAGLTELEIQLAECRLGFGYPDAADKHLATALAADPPPPADRRLEALRLRAEVAAQRRDPAEKQRWTDLEAAAAGVAKSATAANETPLRVTAVRYLSESFFRRGDGAAALAVLAPLPDLHDTIKDPLGRRDTQRLRAKLLAAGGKYPDAAPLFAEAWKLHTRHQPDRRMAGGDILAEWSAAAVAAGDLKDGARLRDEAAAEYRAALVTPAANPDAGGPLATFLRLQRLTRSARQFRQALEVTRTAGERWSGDPLLDGRLNSDRGGLELMTAAYQAARTQLARALAGLDAADPPNLRALPQVLVNLATAELACDAPDAAEALLARCAALYRTHKLPDDSVRAECEYLRGAAAARRGAFSPAMGFFREGLRLCAAAGPPADPVRFNLWLNTALIHKEQGDAAAAGEALREAVVVLARSAEPDDLSAALIDAVRADLFVSQGQVPQAVAVVPAIEAVCTRHALTAGYLWATARHVRALDRLAARDVPAAEAIWANLAAAHRREKSALLPRTLNFLGVCADLRGDDAAARARFEESLAFQTGRPNGPPVTRAVTLWRLAVLDDRAGHKAGAKKRLAEVFDVADRARLNTFGEAAQRAQFFAQFAPAFELLAKWHARDGDGEGLLRVVARSRSRTLLDQTLAAGVDPRDRLAGDGRGPLLAREAAARAAVSRLRGKVMLLPADRPDDPAAARLLAELEAAQKEYAETWREIVNADPVTRVLTDPAAAEASLARVRAEIHAAGGALLVYMLGRDESFAVLCADGANPPEVFRLTVPRDAADGVGDAPAGETAARAGFRGVSIRSAFKQPDRPTAPAGLAVPLTDAAAGRLVDHYLQQIADPAFNPTRGVKLVSRRAPGGATTVTPEVLGDAVLPAALRERIRTAGVKRLVVIPDGPLHKLPFEALLVTAGNAPRYALDDLPAVCYAPSPAVLGVVMARPRTTDGPASLLTVGDPAYPDEKPALPAGATASRSGGGGALPRLPYTAVESRRIRTFFPADRVAALEGDAATEANVVAAMAGKRFVHLAAHGFADQQFGNLFAAVALTPPPADKVTPENDGFLTLHEIHRLKLAGCELTVLSACVTNVGPQRPLEAGVTLAGAFLCAGSRGVMASCWSVDDKATADLMGAYFAAVNPGGGKPGSHADALKAARVAVRAKPGWEAPFFWAPFVYVGPPD